MKTLTGEVTAERGCWAVTGQEVKGVGNEHVSRLTCFWDSGHHSLKRPHHLFVRYLPAAKLRNAHTLDLYDINAMVLQGGEVSAC